MGYRTDIAIVFHNSLKEKFNESILNFVKNVESADHYVQKDDWTLIYYDQIKLDDDTFKSLKSLVIENLKMVELVWTGDEMEDLGDIGYIDDDDCPFHVTLERRVRLCI